jgi:hypothetical protein
MDWKTTGTFDALVEARTDTNRRNTMKGSLTSRKPHQGPCMCDDCGKLMQWKGTDWCITNNGYLLCSSCMLSWVRENRYHKDAKKEAGAFGSLTAAA